jgi:hypothetical protein
MFCAARPGQLLDIAASDNVLAPDNSPALVGIDDTAQWRSPWLRRLGARLFYSTYCLAAMDLRMALALDD